MLQVDLEECFQVHKYFDEQAVLCKPSLFRKYSSVSDKSISKSVKPITINTMRLFSFVDEQIEFIVISVEFLIVVCV